MVWHVRGVVARGFMKTARGVLEKETVGTVPRGRVVVGAVTTGGGWRIREVKEGDEKEKYRGEDEE